MSHFDFGQLPVSEIEREGHEMEVLGFAADKAREALSEYHSYEDGKLDMPILTPDTVLDKDDI